MQVIKILKLDTMDEGQLVSKIRNVIGPPPPDMELNMIEVLVYVAGLTQRAYELGYREGVKDTLENGGN